MADGGSVLKGSAAGADEASSPLWTPEPGYDCAMRNFMQTIQLKHGACLDTYDDLWKWSVENYALFWEEFWHFSNIIHSKPYEQVVDKAKVISDIPEWFAGSKLNFAENLLRYCDDRVAIVYYNERHERKQVTYEELHRSVARLAAAMKMAGIKQGDRVAGYLPVSIFTVEAMLATASIGALWTAVSPEIQSFSATQKFSQINPRLLFSVDAVLYNNKVHPHLDKTDQLTRDLPSLELVVLVPHVAKQEDIKISQIPKCMFLLDFLQSVPTIVPLEFTQLPFSHPLYIMYSSGTTGPPKCLVHSSGGTLIQHLKEHVLHGDLKRSDKLMFITSTGWMMWNWLVSALGTGCSLVILDGSPMQPSIDSVWDIVHNEGVTSFGCGAAFLQILEKNNLEVKQNHQLDSLRFILSTGSVLPPRTFDYIYQSIKSNVIVSSISGGTDIISCFCGQNPIVPVHRGEIQAKNLGMDIVCFNEDGVPSYDEDGELVCVRPFPSMPVMFWDDPDGSKYHQAYFNVYKGIWYHGDYCRFNSRTGGIVMLGRSDGTLNPNGVRFGSAEIYSVVESFTEIADSLCVSQHLEEGERVHLFLKMAPGHCYSEQVKEAIKRAILLRLSPRHIPQVIAPIDEIPYTSSGKKVEVAVKKILSGRAVKNASALSNPLCLDLYRKFVNEHVSSP